MYDKLRDLLSTGKWEAANQVTWKLIHENILKITANDDKVLALNTIDSLWVEHSKGHFGFSIQRRILEKAYQKWESAREEILKICESQTNPEYRCAEVLWGYKEPRLIYETFIQHIGWNKTGNYQNRVDLIIYSQEIPRNYDYVRNDSEIIFSLDAPEGHLPYHSSFNLKNVERGYYVIEKAVNEISSFYSIFKGI